MVTMVINRHGNLDTLSISGFLNQAKMVAGYVRGQVGLHSELMFTGPPRRTPPASHVLMFIRGV